MCVAAVWGMLTWLDVPGLIDAVIGPRRLGVGASTGTYLALAALNRVVVPCSELAFADWWRSTAADRFTRIPVRVLDHRKFWEAMHTLTLEQWAQIEHRVALRVVEEFGVDIGSLALDMTNVATFLDTGNTQAPIAQRGKATQKRADLRLVGLGLLVSRDGGIPLVSHAYPGNKPDVTQFATVIDLLAARHAALAGHTGSDAPVEMTVVFDAGQNSAAHFAHLAEAGLHYVGSVPPSDVPDLLAVPATRRRIVDAERFGPLTALDTRREIYGTDRHVVLTHSPTLHAKQSRGVDQRLAKVGARLSELAATLARGKTRRSRSAVEAEITTICRDSWVTRVLRWQLQGDIPAEHRLSWSVRRSARAALEREVFGKRVPDHRPGGLVSGRGRCRLPLPLRGRVRFPSQERPARCVVQPDASLERPHHPSPRIHLRVGPADRAPDAPHGRPSRPVHQCSGVVEHRGRDRGKRAGPADADRDHSRTGPTCHDLRARPVGATDLGHRPAEDQYTA